MDLKSPGGTLPALDGRLHIVALMGPDAFTAALDRGADIVIEGRSTDAGVIAAFAIW